MRASFALSQHALTESKTAISHETDTSADDGEETFSPPATLQQSQWHSPVPYLFGGLAAMLGLIAFALLILACSYWKLSSSDDGGERNVEGGEDTKEEPAFEENLLVIMAGDVKPTFLATPTTSRGSWFNDDKINVKDKENHKSKDDQRISIHGDEFREIELNQEHVQR